MPTTMPTTVPTSTRNRNKSTGPRTPEGKAASSRNATKLGLFSAHDFILPEDQPAYDELSAAFWKDLSPEGPVEETLALEIIRASWRLQRCAKAEWKMVERTLEIALEGQPAWKDGEIVRTPLEPKDPLQSEAGRNAQQAIDRARANANTTFRRALADLRRLQTERQIAQQNEVPVRGVADPRQLTAARESNRHSRQQNVPAPQSAPSAPKHNPPPPIEIQSATERTAAPPVAGPLATIPLTRAA